MAKVEEELSTAAQNAGADDADAPGAVHRPARSRPRARRATSWSGSGARRSARSGSWRVSGIILLGFVLAHMIGNLKVFLGKEHINVYGEWLRDPRRAGAAPHGPAVGHARSG